MKHLRRIILLLIIYTLAFSIASGAESYAATARTSLRDCTITVTESLRYNGKARSPKVTIYYNDVKLKKNRDYTLTYTDNVNAGTGTVLIQGIGNYKSKLKRQFTIKPRSLSATDISAESTEFLYTGSRIYLRPQIRYDGKRLKKNQDYTITYKNNINCGTATATLKGTGNFYGTRKLDYDILPSTTVAFTEASKSITAGDHSQLLNIDGFTADTKVTSVKSTDKLVMRVAHNGNGGIILEARNPGNVTITAIVDGQLLTCDITVLPIYVERVSFDLTTSRYIKVGDVIQNTATAYPENASDRGLKYTSTNPEVAIVDETTGEVTAIAPGTANIKAKAVDGSKVSSKYKIYVRDVLKRDSTHFVAHRGLCTEAPENTVQAFRLAGENGFWGIETDVRKTADGQFVLSHNPTLLRACGVDKPIEEMTFDEIKALDVISGTNIDKYQGECKIASLSEYLEICKEYKCVPVIEVKMYCDKYAVSDPEYIDDTGLAAIVGDPDYLLPMQPATEEELKNLYEQTRKIMGTERQYSFIAFDIRTATLLGKMAKNDGATNITVEHVTGPDVNVSNISYYRNNGIELDVYYTVSAETVKTFRDAGIKVNIWVINTQYKTWTVINNGIDSITTNKVLWD